MKRKKSAREYRMKKIQRRGYAKSQLSQGNDDNDNFLQAPNIKTTTCTLCCQPRHTLMSCDKLSGYYRAPLAKHDEKVQIKLTEYIMKTDIYKVTTINDNNDEDIIVKMLIGIKALILSEKCECIDEEGETADGETADILLRCTLLFEED